MRNSASQQNITADRRIGEGGVRPKHGLIIERFQLRNPTTHNEGVEGLPGDVINNQRRMRWEKRGISDELPEKSTAEEHYHKIGNADGTGIRRESANAIFGKERTLGGKRESLVSATVGRTGSSDEEAKKDNLGKGGEMGGVDEINAKAEAPLQYNRKGDGRGVTRGSN